MLSFLNRLSNSLTKLRPVLTHPSQQSSSMWQTALKYSLHHSAAEWHKRQQKNMRSASRLTWIAPKFQGQAAGIGCYTANTWPILIWEGPVSGKQYFFSICISNCYCILGGPQQNSITVKTVSWTAEQKKKSVKKYKVNKNVFLSHQCWKHNHFNVFGRWFKNVFEFCLTHQVLEIFQIFYCQVKITTVWPKFINNNLIYTTNHGSVQQLLRRRNAIVCVLNRKPKGISHSIRVSNTYSLWTVKFSKLRFTWVYCNPLNS